jgi:hypothetical protein
MSEQRQITLWRDLAGKTIKSVVEYASGDPCVGVVILFEGDTFAALERDTNEPDLVRRRLTIDQALTPEELVAAGVYTEEQAQEFHRKRKEKEHQEDLARIAKLTAEIDAIKRRGGPFIERIATEMQLRVAQDDLALGDTGRSDA